MKLFIYYLIALVISFYQLICCLLTSSEVCMGYREYKISRAILEHYSERQSFTRKSVLPMQPGLTGSCEPPGRAEIHNPGRVHYQSAGSINILYVLRKFLDCCNHLS